MTACQRLASLRAACGCTSEIYSGDSSNVTFDTFGGRVKGLGYELSADRLCVDFFFYSCVNLSFAEVSY